MSTIGVEEGKILFALVIRGGTVKKNVRNVVGEVM